MKLKPYIILLILISICYPKLATSKIDSLKNILKAVNNKRKVEILNQLCDSYVYSNTDSAMKYGNVGLELAKKEGLEILEAAILTNIGNIFLQKGEYSQALGKYIIAEKIYKNEKDVDGELGTIMNIGYIYELQNLFDLSLKQYELALSISKENENKNFEAQVLGHLGSLYYAKSDKTKALEYFSLSLKTNQEINNVPGIMEGLNNVAVIYQELGKYKEALQNFNTDLAYAKQRGIKTDVIAVMHNIALVYKDQKNYKQAITYIDSSIAIGLEIKDFEKLEEVYATLSEIYKEQNNIEKAFEYFKLSATAKDSLISQTRDKQFIEMSTKYDTEKKDAENKLLKTESDKQKAISISITIGLILVAALAFFIFRGYRFQQKANVLLGSQNREIKGQKHIIEEKQKEILDSISYAKRLQDAILPPINLLNKHFKALFIYYQPKDIVAGDFYWFESVQSGKSFSDANTELLFIAAADCTGHGVPGALVSVVCSNALNRAVKEFNCTEPGMILNKARELVVETFAKSEKNVKDGMDISLLSLQKNKNDNSVIAKWAGANNPIWFVRKTLGADGSEHRELKQIKPDKFPVGAYVSESRENFKTHSVNLNMGDRVYLFSDGFADQFGGEKEKKYKYKQLEEKLLASAHLPMEEQKTFMKYDLISWQGKLEQVDDILLIGIEV